MTYTSPLLMRCLTGAAILGLLLCSFVSGNQSSDPKAVVAKVNGEPIYAAQVDAEFRAAFGNKQLAEDDQQRLKRAALDQVIDRHLVLTYLTKTGQAASKADIDFELSQFEKDLKSQNLSLAEHSKNVGLSEDEIRRALAWKISWKRYCEKYLTPQNLEKYFQQHRRDFDGTELRVAQILFKLKPEADDSVVTTATENATKLREEIVNNKISFADAAKKDSQAPSKDDGGDIGWIERHGPMPEDFSRSAFALKKGEVSEPLKSSFGIHLITVVEEKPGGKTSKDVEAELRPAVVVYLFRFVADKERATAKIEYVDPK